ncbi:hypothetical protein [Nannocystis bainbridge]|uniref:Uncharacterized protein n=1 Tax=Nannocystis bainbridge TaxID=2995303 RepID=A0ABT5E2Z3_9BACT|nr:hypothetical protein [Nannocystis bainbridge]MDC0720120.1 hypothetical protein [Nannocystis bainbridge]
MSLRPSVILLLAACARDPDSPGAGGSDGSAATTTTSTTTSMTTVEPTSATGSGDDPTTHGFIRPPDGGGGKKECSIFEQDCPEGKKCAPYSADGDNSWDTVKCVDVVSDPAGLGELCEVLGAPASGADTCDEGFICLYVQWPELEGTCIAYCQGSPDEPLCGPGTDCTTNSDGIVHLCLPECDPLLQDCPGDELCIAHPDDGDWTCVFDSSGDEGQPFDACEYASACDPGLLCLPPEFAVECDPVATGCCLPLCDLELPNTCPGQGQQCVAWYAPGEAPPGKDHLGQCALP